MITETQLINLEIKIPELAESIRDLICELNEVKKERDWLSVHAPESAYKASIGDIACPCNFLIDYKNKKRCPLWTDYYGEFSEQCPDGKFEDWIDYVFGDDYDSIDCGSSSHKCWLEAAKLAIKKEKEGE